MRKLAFKMVVFLLSMLLILSACQNKGSSGIGGGTANESNLSQKNFPAKIENPYVKILSHQNPLDDVEGVLARSIDAFEKKYGGKVTVDVIGYGEYQTRLIAMLGAGDAPDVTHWDHNHAPLFFVKELIQPIEQYTDLDDPMFDKVALGHYMWKGRFYGIGGEGDPFYIIFNKTMFENNGIKTPLEYYKEGKWTWETFRVVAMQFIRDIDGNGTIDQWGYAEGGGNSRFPNANGGNYVNYLEDGRVVSNVDDPKVVEALQFVQDAMNVDKYMRTAKIEEFYAGKIAMYAERVRDKHKESMKDELDYAPWPLGPGQTEHLYPSSCGYWGIPTGAKNPEGAAAWLCINYKMNKDMEEEKYTKMLELYTKEQIQFFKDARKHMQFDKASFLKKGMKPLWQDILNKKTPVLTAIEKFKPTFQDEINTSLSE